MSEKKTTHFQFSLGNIELEISGEREFVERMYRMIMRDIESSRGTDEEFRETIRTTQKLTGVQPESKEDTKKAILDTHGRGERPVVWVHRCGDMMHKIYMSSPQEMAKAEILRIFDTDWLGVVFANDDAINRVLPAVDRGQTLWAELTPEGRRRIAQASVDE